MVRESSVLSLAESSVCRIPSAQRMFTALAPGRKEGGGSLQERWGCGYRVMYTAQGLLFTVGNRRIT